MSNSLPRQRVTPKASSGPNSNSEAAKPSLEDLAEFRNRLSRAKAEREKLAAQHSHSMQTALARRDNLQTKAEPRAAQ
jgi:hypothetical protein